MSVECFIDPRFKENFADNLENIVNKTVQEAIQLAPVHVRQEHQPTETSKEMTSSTPDKAATSLGFTGLLKKMTATRQQRTDDHRTQEDQGPVAQN